MTYEKLLFDIEASPRDVFSMTSNLLRAVFLDDT